MNEMAVSMWGSRKNAWTILAFTTKSGLASKRVIEKVEDIYHMQATRKAITGSQALND